MRRLDRRLRTSRASSLLRVFGGMLPTSPIPGSRSLRTRVRSGVQETPTQVQTGVARFQLRLRRWGTAAKLRSACLSEFRSEIAGGRRVIMIKREVSAEVWQNLMGSCLTKGL